MLPSPEITSKKALSTGLLGVVGLFPLFWIIPDWAWPPWNIVGILIEAGMRVLQVFVTALLDVTGTLFLITAERLLIIENPADIDPLNDLWFDLLPAYLTILFVGFIAYLSYQFVLIDNEKASLQRMIGRMMLSIIIVMVSREVFALAVSMSNDFIRVMLPNTYTFQSAVDVVEVSLAGVGSVTALFFIAVIGAGTLFISGLLFFLVLMIRIVMIYIIYVSLPLLIGLATFDVGPLKYGQKPAKVLIKLAIALLLIGVVMSGLIATGGHVADGYGTISDNQEGTAAAHEAPGTVETTSDTVIITPPGDTPRPAAGDQPQGIAEGPGAIVHFLQMFIFVGIIWTCIGSMAAVGKIMTGIARTTNYSLGGDLEDQDQGPNQPWAVKADSGETHGSTHAAELDDGSVVLANPAGSGVQLNPDSRDNPVETFDAENNPLVGANAPPNQFNTVQGSDGQDGTPVSEKIGYFKDRATEKIPDTQTPTPSNGQGSNDTSGSPWSVLSSEDESPANTTPTQDTSDSNVLFPEQLEDTSDIESNDLSNIDKNQAKEWLASGKTGWLGEGYTGLMIRSSGKQLAKAPNRVRRATVAGGKIGFKSLGGEEIAETRRIAQESPILNPNKPETGSPTAELTSGITEQGPSQDWTFEYGQNAWQLGREHQFRAPESGFDGSNIHEYLHGSIVGIRSPAYIAQHGDRYGPRPTVDGKQIRSAAYKKSTNIAQEFQNTSLEQISEDNLESQLNQVTHGSGVADTTIKQFQTSLDHLRQSPLPSDVAIQRATENVLDSRGLPIGEHFQKTAHYESIGIGKPSLETSTAFAVRRRKALQTVDDLPLNTSIVTRNDGSKVRMREYSSLENGKSRAHSEVLSESILTVTGASVPKRHYDPQTDVVRQQEVENATPAQDLLDGNHKESLDELQQSVNEREFLKTYGTLTAMGYDETNHVGITQSGTVVQVKGDGIPAKPTADEEPAVLDEATELADKLDLDVGRGELINAATTQASHIAEPDPETLVENHAPDIDQIDTDKLEQRDDIDWDKSDAPNSPEEFKQQLEHQRNALRKNAELIQRRAQRIGNANAEWQNPVAYD